MSTITFGYAMVDTELYKVFYTVGKYRNISAAARALFVTQPAVSKAIKKLEYLIGCTLFIRSSKGVTLTTEGRILYRYVEDGFTHLQSGEQVLQKLRNREAGIVNVGISNTLCKYFFLPHLERFHLRYPGIKISIINRTSPETLELLNQGKIDFGIISIPQVQAGYRYRELMTIQDVFVSGRKYPELQQPVPLSRLEGYPLMMLEKNNISRDHIDGYLQANTSRLTPELEIGSMDFLIEFARIDLGIALVIRNFVEQELTGGVLFEVQVTPPIPPRKVGLVTQENLPLSIAAETFIESICR